MAGFLAGVRQDLAELNGLWCFLYAYILPSITPLITVDMVGSRERRFIVGEAEHMAMHLSRIEDLAMLL